jgi:hypothetical protein
MQGSPPGREGSAPEGSREISAIRDRSALCPGFFSLLLQHGKIIAQGACQEKDALKEKRLIVLCLHPNFCLIAAFQRKTEVVAKDRDPFNQPPDQTFIIIHFIWKKQLR